MLTDRIHDLVYEDGAITLLTEVTEKEFGGLPFAEPEEQVAGGMVGKVAMVAADALLEVERPLGEVEHLVVVVRLEDEDVR
jgi:hypothetical protein